MWLPRKINGNTINKPHGGNTNDPFTVIKKKKFLNQALKLSFQNQV